MRALIAYTGERNHLLPLSPEYSPGFSYLRLSFFPSPSAIYMFKSAKLFSNLIQNLEATSATLGQDLYKPKIVNM